MDVVGPRPAPGNGGRGRGGCLIGRPPVSWPAARSDGTGRWHSSDRTGRPRQSGRPMGRPPEPVVGRPHWPSAASDGRRFRLGGHPPLQADGCLLCPHFFSSTSTSEELQFDQPTCCFLRGEERKSIFWD